MSKSIIEKNLDKLTNIFETSKLCDETRLDILKQIKSIKKMIDESDESTRLSILNSKNMAELVDTLVKREESLLNRQLKEEEEEKRVENIKKLFEKMDDLINKIKDDQNRELSMSESLFNLEKEFKKTTKPTEQNEIKKGLTPTI